MDKLINDRKKQLLDMQQMLRMQDLLEQYDRENLFLNRQVDTLLKQNILLKQQKSLLTSVSSAQLTSDYYGSRNSKVNITAFDDSKSQSYQKRKSRYQYMVDDDEIRDLKSNLKNQMKREATKNLNTREVKAGIEELNIRIPSKLNEGRMGFSAQSQKEKRTDREKQVTFQLNKPQQMHKFSGEKFTPVKRHQETYAERQSQNGSPQNSMSKSKSKSKEKLKVSLKASRILNEPKPVESTQAKTHSPKRQEQKTQPKQQFTMNQIESGAQVFLQHSFGNKSAQRLQKKFTLIEADLSLGQSQQENQKPKADITESRMSNKFIPLSIESKQLPKNTQNQTPQDFSKQLYKDPSRELSYQMSRQLSKQISINVSKTQLQKPGLSIYSQPAIRSESKQKRNHSLNPSPKVQYNPAQISTHKIKPFVIQTEEVIPAASGPSVELHRNPSELHRNPSEKIKRKFIKIVSSQKIPAPQSPKK